MVPAPMRMAIVDADEDPVAQQGQVEHGDGHALLHCTNATPRRGHDQAAEGGDGGPSPVAALAQGEDERLEGEGDQHAPGDSRSSGTGPGPATRHLAAVMRHTDHGDAGVHPEQPLPAGRPRPGRHRAAARRRPRRRPPRPRARPPAAGLAAGLRHRQQAEPARQDRRASRALDAAAGDDHATRAGQRDQHAGSDEEQQAELEDALPARTRHPANRTSRWSRRPPASSR